MQEFNLLASDGCAVACYAWQVADAAEKPTPAEKTKVVVQIAHGMGEHAQRYDAVARQLVAAGISVYASDHRGHGATGPEQAGYMGGDGWNRTLADMYELNRHIAAAHTDARLVLLGHSMGAMLSQQYITRYGASIDALVLSGSPGFKTWFAGRLMALLATVESWRLGAATASPIIQNQLFAGANKAFAGPGASGFEWLSKDAHQVQKYVDDPACGFVLTAGSIQDMAAGTAMTSSAACCSKIPRHLPVYVFSGTDDPVHGEKKDIQRMLQAYHKHGLQQVAVKWYEQGRHEMFNESNADEVVADLLAWLDKLPPLVKN